jgi:putative ABC transport system ATP-binding protein
MLQILKIRKSFAEQAILRGLSFDAYPGQLTILEGQNGAGKSTLFNILVGNLRPDDGQIILNNHDITLDKALDRAHKIAILKQDPKTSSAPNLSVLENCALAFLKNQSPTLSYALKGSIREKIRAHLKNLGLNYEDQWDKAMGTLSGGQRQIIAFAMATIYKPELLLLDEPTAALDDSSTHVLMKLIKKLITTWNIPAVMISHDHALNQSYSDKIIILKEGICEQIM